MRFLFLFISTLTFAQEVTVFQSGTEGYASFRIPAIVQDPQGKLYAFSEGRVNHAGDFGNVDLVLKTSEDGGRTWSSLVVLVDYEQLQAGNPAPVVDTFDPAYPQGRIFLFYNTGDNHEPEVRKGNGLRQVWYITSADAGKTWSAPANISSQVHKPSKMGFVEDWRTYANTPGHALQFFEGPKKGRIYVAANHNAGPPQDKNKDWVAHAFYSDDHGKSFQLSENVPFPGSNESMAAQVGDLDLYMSSRNMQLQPRQRIISRSRDGGETWYSSNLDPALPDPINQASVLSWREGEEYVLVHVNAADPEKRNRLTARWSRDGGRSWIKSQVIAEAPEGYKGDYSAYSDAVHLGKGRLGILYEKDNYKKIVFTVLESQP
jgi:sialidase-1